MWVHRVVIGNSQSGSHACTTNTSLQLQKPSIGEGYLTAQLRRRVEVRVTVYSRDYPVNLIRGSARYQTHEDVLQLEAAIYFT